jgi:2'-5' RNA ligase
MDRTDLVVVALPREGDYVRKISSEKEPHLTLLYLGANPFDAAEMELVVGQVEHAASQLSPFTLEVEKRGELGDKNADVLFFSKEWMKDVALFRNHLLQNELIRKAYLIPDQFPSWTPHLTLGYPDNPAKDLIDHREVTYVSFDRIALWVDDSVGPTFELKHPETEMAVAMSQIERGRIAMDDLYHYGVKGMRWGVRRSDAELASAPSGPKPRLSEDARNASKLHDKIQTKGTGSLSNQEMRQYLERMDLERRFQQSITSPSPQQQAIIDRGHNQVKKMLAIGNTIEKTRKFLETPTGEHVKTGLKTAAAATFGYFTGGVGPAAAAGAGVVVRRMTQ